MWVFVKRETGEQQWERLLAEGASKRAGATTHSLNCPVNRNIESKPDDKARGRTEGKSRGTRRKRRQKGGERGREGGGVEQE